MPTSSSRQRIRVFDTANDLYHSLMDHLAQQVNGFLEKKKYPTFALATGNTMIPLYRMMTDNQEKLHTELWNCFNLDEYYPLNDENATQSFYAYMQTHFYSRLKNPVRLKRILNGRARDPVQECIEYEKQIQEVGGIDICILGLGQNGHIGFNEPGSEPASRTHVVNLHADTLLANFKGQAPFHQAMTMGIDSILESRHIVIIALGKSKASAVKSAITETQTRQVPASFLQDHFSVSWFLDKDAASLLD